jgi:Zn-dependent protease with chaperone function
VLPLVEVSKVPELEITFNITEAAVPNAFALPDGSIFFTTQLLKIAETPEEILAVAGHEIAHVQLRHSLQQLVTRAALSIFIQLLFGDMGGIADLIYAGSELANLKFSRDHERQADITGTSLLRAAQLPAKGAYQFFIRMKDFEEKRSLETGSNKFGSIFSTHPQTDERLAWAAQLPDDELGLTTNEMRATFQELKTELR